MSSLAQRGSFDFDEHLPEMPLLEFENLTDLILFGFLDCILKTVAASPLKGSANNGTQISLLHSSHIGALSK